MSSNVNAESRMELPLIEVKHKIRNHQLIFPHLLSSSRIGLAILISAGLLIDIKVFAIILYAIALITDVFDGKIARSLRCTSRAGLYLDSGADFVLIVCIYIALSMLGRIPGFFLFLPVGMYLQFIISIQLGFQSQDKWGKYYGTCNMALQIFLILIVNNMITQISIVLMFMYSAACLYNRYKIILTVS